MITTLLLVVGGIIIALAVGTLWHMPSAPGGRVHMRAIGFDVLSPEEQQAKIEEAKPGMPKIFVGQALLSALLAGAVVMIMQFSMQNGLSWTHALSFTAVNWLCFMVPVIGGNILWGNYPKDIVWKKFISDALFNLVTIVLIAVMVALVV